MTGSLQQLNDVTKYKTKPTRRISVP